LVELLLKDMRQLSEDTSENSSSEEESSSELEESDDVDSKGLDNK